jgi:histidinol-phosphate aminotransferase
MSWLNSVVRPDILALEPYGAAAWDPAFTRLHANEWPQRLVNDESEAGLNHYPEPQPRALIARLARLYEVLESRVLVGRGSDEPIDLLVRAFCRADQDAVLTCPPTFGMYEAAARIQAAELVAVPLDRARGFALDAGAVLKACTERPVKLLFLCSPNNPTGNLLDEGAIVSVVERLRDQALVVVDEAYLEFSGRPSLAAKLGEYPNLALLRTLSKAHGLAGARVGTLIADPEVIAVIRKLIAPYATPQLTLEAVLGLLSPIHLRNLPRRMREIQLERERLSQALGALPCVHEVHPSDANFLLVRLADPAWALARARQARLLVRDARGYAGLENALRITVGTPEQNARLIEAWR